MLNETLLNQIGVPEEHIQAILDGHNATVNGIREEIELYKTEAEDLRNTSAKLQAAEKELEAIKDTDWKAKHDALKAEFDAVKESDLKQKLYKELAEEVGLPYRYSEKICKKHYTDKLELDKKGGLKDRESLARELEETWAEVIKPKSKPEKVRNHSAALDRIRGIING